jgi:hypothetical protein
MPRPLPYAVVLLAISFSFVTTAKAAYGGDTAFNSNSFNRNYDLPAGSLPIDLAAADLNGDGRKDIVSANYSGTSLSIFKNKSMPGSFGFGQQQVLTVSGKPTSVKLADLDGDGKPDIAVTGELTTLSIFRNTTTGDSITFAAEQTYNTPNYAEGVAIGDLDGDGKPDLAITSNQSNLVSIYRNTSTPGAISFAAPQYFSTGSAPQSAAIADLNGDGLPELIVTNYYGPSISVYKNTSTSGNITFDPKLDFTTGNQPYHVVVGDLDGDGKTDIITGNGNGGSISILRNAGAGGAIAFDAKIDYPIGTTPYGVAVGDLDGDGKPELAAADYSTGPSTISVLRNLSTPGSLTFAAKVDYPTGNSPYNTIISDFNGDGQPDLATANFGGNNISILLNQMGNTTHVTIPVINNFSPSYGPIGTTVNIYGDNFDTVASHNIVYFGAASAVVTRATGTSLTVTVPAGATYTPLSVTVRNLTVYAQQAFYVTFPGANASFGLIPFDSIPYDLGSNNPRRVRIVDLDGDGLTDVLVSDQGSTTITAYRNKSLPQVLSFAPGVSFMSGAGPYDIAIADFNGDGKPDAAVSNFNSGNAGSVSVFQNNSTRGALSFASPLVIPTGAGTLGLAAGDLDGDGKPDLVACSGNAGYLTVFLNIPDSSGGIQFASGQTITKLDHADAAVIGDVDGDGKPDLITANSSGGSITVFKNISTLGNITFDGPQDYPAGSFPTFVTLADLNNDGKPEILVSNYSSSTVTVYQNISQLNAPAFQAIPDLITAKNPYSISVEDLDGDGKPDLVVPADMPSSFGLYKNTSDSISISFASRIDDSTGYGPTYIGIGDLDGDGKPDLAIANHYDRVSVRRNTTGEPLVIGAGANPVQGSVASSFSLDSTVQSYNGSPYVQRHYDIEPAKDPSTATARVTLYFQQQDFDNFNATRGHGPDLPTGPADSTGIANIRIFQFHGTSSSHLPGAYDGGGSIIVDPDDKDIVWVAGSQLWKISFDVKGFSGFFASNKGSSLVTATNDVTGANNQLGLYPNPVTDFVIVQHPSAQAAQLQLVDISGKIIRTMPVEPNTTQTQIFVTGLSKGVYSLVWISKSQRKSQSFLLEGR